MHPASSPPSGRHSPLPAGSSGSRVPPSPVFEAPPPGLKSSSLGMNRSPGDHHLRVNCARGRGRVLRASDRCTFQMRIDPALVWPRTGLARATVPSLLVGGLRARAERFSPLLACWSSWSPWSGRRHGNRKSAWRRSSVAGDAWCFRIGARSTERGHAGDLRGRSRRLGGELGCHELEELARVRLGAEGARIRRAECKSPCCEGARWPIQRPGRRHDGSAFPPRDRAHVGLSCS